MQDWHALTAKEVFEKVSSSEKGLSKKQASERIQKFGKNIIKQEQHWRKVKIFFSQFRSFLVYILLFAILLSVFIHSYMDAIVIGIIVILNVLIGFFQEYKADKAVNDLKKALVQKVIVIREGKHIQIKSEELVQGDLLILNSGERVSADCRLIECNGLNVNEAVLTGESEGILKDCVVIDKSIPINERKNIVYAGTSILSGSGIGIVFATGKSTEFGKIASELQNVDDTSTPIQKRMDKLSKNVGVIIIGVVVLVMLLGFLEHFDKREMILTALALAVSAIPSGLPAVMAIAFAISSIFMSRKNVIVRHLPAVESLGSVTMICTDKTGTLTKEKMIVQEILAGSKIYDLKEGKIYFEKKEIDPLKNKDILQLIKTGVLASNARYEKDTKGYRYVGDPIEEAILRVSIDAGIYRKDLTEKEPRIKEFGFDSERKIMSILRNSGRGSVLYSKGAIENILDLCGSELVDGDVKRLTIQRKKAILKEAEKMSKKALRVLSFAYKNSTSQVCKEEGLIFVGLAGMIDPPREEVKYAIEECKKAGIKIKMITGDSLQTAVAVADLIGIEGNAIEGHEIDIKSDKDLIKILEKTSIFARVTPKQKLRIAQILQSNGEIIAMTGDGVNDVLALKVANVGIAMGIKGTDVARDISDVVLSDDNFASLVAGVKEGRRIYDNIKKFIKYILSVNFSEIALISTSLLLKMPLPLLPLQILWLNLLSDGPPSLTLIFEKEKDVMNSQPRKEKNILSGIGKFIILGGMVNFLACLFVYFLGLSQGLPIEYVRTMILTTSVVYELTFVYVCRSEESLFKIGIFSNKWLNYAVLSSLIIQIIFIYSGIGKLFGVVPISLESLGISALFGISGLVLFELWKISRKIYNR